MTIGERINAVRKSESVTLEEFGKKIGITKSAVGNIEHGRSNLSEQVILAICREFNVNETWLRTGEGEMFVQRGRDDEIEKFFDNLLREEDDSFRRRFIAALCRLDTEQWKMAERFVADVAGNAQPMTPEEEIEAEVDAYRRQLIAEKKTAASDSSQSAAGGAGGSESA